MLTNALQKCEHFIVVAGKEMTNEALDEQDSDARADMVKQGRKTPQKGQMTPVQLLVKGAITRIAPDKSFLNVGHGNAHGFLGDATNLLGHFKRSKTEIDVTVQVVDASTRQVVASRTVTGSTSKFDLGLVHTPLVSGVEFGGNRDMMGAVVHAVNQSVDFLVEQLPKIVWEGTVVSAEDGTVAINRGEREGVRAGMCFEVGAVKTLRDPDTGEVLDQRITPAATLKATEVHDKVAYCKVVKSSGPIEGGMMVRPLGGQN